MKKSFSINSFFNKNIKEIMDTETGKYFSKDFIRHCVCLQLGPAVEMEDQAFQTIWYGGRKHEFDSSRMVYNFWIRNKKASLADFWDNLRFTTEDWASKWLMEKHHMTLLMADAAAQCISCILNGYECSFNPKETIPSWKKVWARHFNLYLSRRHQYIGTSNMWNDEVASKWFCTQFPDTEFNRQAISLMEYGPLSHPRENTYGLKLKSTDILLSELVLSFLDPVIFKKLKRSKRFVSGKGELKMRLTENEIEDALHFIYLLLDDYNVSVCKSPATTQQRPYNK